MGFPGGVPPNTETAAVNPRFGIDTRWKEVSVLCPAITVERHSLPGAYPPP